MSNEAMADRPKIRPVESDYASQVAYTRALEAYCDGLADQPAPTPPAWWPAVENILKEYGLQAIDFVADFKVALAVQQILSAFPLFDDEGLDEEKHHCEWTLQQDRKRLHAMLAAAPQPAQRKPMTDEQIKSMWRRGAIFGTNDEKAIAIARAIEAAHNIKEQS